MLLHVSIHDFNAEFYSPNNYVEVFEYDATKEPPSMMDVEALDFKGPFAEASSLGYAKINFLKLSLQ